MIQWHSKLYCVSINITIIGLVNTKKKTNHKTISFELKDLFLLLTSSSFSAVGLFFGFLVRASLTKWWKLFVLLFKNKRTVGKRQVTELIKMGGVNNKLFPTQ